MHSSRRSFLRGASAIGAVATLGGLNSVSAETKPAKPAGMEKKGLARGLTLLTMRRNGEYRLGAKTSEGILDVKEAAGLLKLYSPATLDDMLQREEGASVQAVVDAAMKSNAARKLFLKEENIEYGPLVTRPEKIVCVGLNFLSCGFCKKESATCCARPEAENWSGGGSGTGGRASSTAPRASRSSLRKRKRYCVVDGQKVPIGEAVCAARQSRATATQYELSSAVHRWNTWYATR